MGGTLRKTLAAIALLVLLVGVAVAMEEDGTPAWDNVVESEKTGNKETGSNATLFANAIVAISLGAMGAAASLHFLYTEHKKRSNAIIALDRFVASTCCIVSDVDDQMDVEPVIEEIRTAESENEKEVQELSGQEEALLDRYFKVEADLTRIMAGRS